MKKVKYIFFFMMFFYISFHFILPSIFYWINGYTPTYQGEVFDKSIMIKGALLNAMSILLGAVLIFFTKKDFVIKEIDYKSKLYLALSVVFTIGSAWTIGDFRNALNPSNSPTGFFIFYGMFFNFDFYFLFALAASSEFLAAAQSLVFLKGLVSASRSASLSLFLFFIYSLWSKNAFRFFKKYLIYFLIFFSLTFFSFHWADKIRNPKGNQIEDAVVIVPVVKVEGIRAISSESKPVTALVAAPIAPSWHSKILNSFKLSKGLFNVVVGRMSFLEAAMLPMLYKDKKLENLDIFYEKYSLSSQIKLVLNNTLPIKFFKFDVYPCQYYKAAFLKMPIEIAQQSYLSINMTLPVYFYMYSNFYIAVLLSGVAIWVYYLMTLGAFRVHPLAGAVFIYVFYGGFLNFFDWVMVIKPGVVGILSVMVFIMTSKIQEKITDFLKYCYKAK